MQMDPKAVLAIEILRGGDGRMRIAIQVQDLGYEGFGLLVADIVRHGALAFKVDEEQVWDWVERERIHPTTPITAELPN